MNVLAGHLIGDFLFQNRWMARIKNASVCGMALHCLIATLPVCAMAGWWDLRGIIAFLAHFAIDRLAIGKKIWPDLIRQGNPATDDPAIS